MELEELVLVVLGLCLFGLESVLLDLLDFLFEFEEMSADGGLELFDFMGVFIGLLFVGFFKKIFELVERVGFLANEPINTFQLLF